MQKTLLSSDERTDMSTKEEVLYRKVAAAISANNQEKLRMLLSKKEAMKSIRKTGGDVLSYSYCFNYAIDFGHIECMQELLKAGGNPCIVGEFHPVSRTIVYGGDTRILKLLLEHGAKPDDSPPHQHKPLYTAATFADPVCFRMLLLYGADPDYNSSDRDFLNSTPDATSVLGKCLTEDLEAPFLNLLIQFGANMYLPDIQKILIQIDNDATKLLERERAYPRSLMSQCRIAIRRLLKQVGKLCLIDQLEIPNQLVKYLQYHDELDYPEKLPRHYVVMDRC